jgi:hypothetical protein
MAGHSIATASALGRNAVDVGDHMATHSQHRIPDRVEDRNMVKPRMVVDVYSHFPMVGECTIISELASAVFTKGK